jgi:hypothetical protein
MISKGVFIGGLGGLGCDFDAYTRLARIVDDKA